MITNIKQVVDNGLCVSCGICNIVDKNKDTFMVEKNGILIPDLDYINEELFDICPGKGYPIVQLGNELFSDTANNSIDFGRWEEAYAIRSVDEEILKNASSGGIMTSIAKYLLENKYIDGIVTTKIEYGVDGPRPKSFIATNFEELQVSQVSKYAPVAIFEIIKIIENFNGRLLFIGIPCHIAALRLMQKNNQQLKEKIPLTMSNFCGGYRDLSETDKIIERTGFDKQNVVSFRYRGGGQPGTMRIVDKYNNQVDLKYPNYARMTGVIKHLRCRLCVDATGELSDFSCGDAWLPKYQKSTKAWSIIFLRSKEAVEIIAKMSLDNHIIKEDISVEDIKKSQEGNLVSKKIRQEARRNLYNLLGYKLPYYDGGYYSNNSGLLFELKVHISHTIFSLLEKIGLYKYFAKLIKRYPKE